MNKLRALIKSLDEQELQLIKKDLAEGNLHKLVEERLQEQTPSPKICPVCNTEITTEGLTLSFGSKILKQARFCGKDCLQYFIEQKV